MNNTILSLVPIAELRNDSTMFPVIEAQQAISQSGREFCRRHKLPEHVFYYWQRKYRDQCVEVEGFVQLETEKRVRSCASVRMSLGNGRSLDFGEHVSATYLAELIRELG